MFTVMAGYEELSTWPTNCLVMIGNSPFIPSVLLTSSQLTLGVTFGVRP